MDRYFPEGDKTSIFSVYGYVTAQTLIQVLKQCGDELTRASVMKQAANLKDFELGLLLPGIRINTSPAEYFPIEQMQMSRFNGEHSELFWSDDLRRSRHPIGEEGSAVIAVADAIFLIDGQGIAVGEQAAFCLCKVQADGFGLAAIGEDFSDIIHVRPRLVLFGQLFERDKGCCQSFEDNPFVVACDSFPRHRLTPAAAASTSCAPVYCDCDAAAMERDWV